MKLQINGEHCQFIPIREFRIRHLLPPDFRISTFLPTVCKGLSRINEAQSELQMVHTAVVASVPDTLPQIWMDMTLELQEVFHTQLVVINHNLLRTIRN